MFFNKKWNEVFFSMDYTKFLKAQGFLQENGIAFKAVMQDNHSRLSANHLGAPLVSLSRDGAVNSYYYIKVKENDCVMAKKILLQHKLI